MKRSASGVSSSAIRSPRSSDIGGNDRAYTWQRDELFIRISGERYYLWRAESDGKTLYILVQKRRSYQAAHRTTCPSVYHCTMQYGSNRAEVSHQPTRQRERHMRRFKSLRHVQRFLYVDCPVNFLFRIGRHSMKAAHYRLCRDEPFAAWRDMTTGLALA